MKRDFHTKKKTTEDGELDDSDECTGKESDYGDDDRMPDKDRRSDEAQEAEETDGSVRDITPSMKEWEKVTGQK